MAYRPRKPLGSDPRLALGSAELEAASAAAYPQVAGKPSKFDFGMLAMAAAAFAIGAVTWITLTAHTVPSTQSVTRAPVAKPAAQQQTTATPLSVPQSSLATVSPMQGGALFPRPASAIPVTADSHAPVMIIDNSLAKADSPGNKAAGDSTAALLDPNELFAARVGAAGENISSRIADPARTIPQGAVIPAVLETALNSDLPGFVRAIVSREIKGFDGSTVLVPRGSRLIGQYKSNLSSGVKRMYVIWERLLRPDGVSIKLGSPATDEIGQAGIAGEVETHFLKRFGAAMVLSVVSGLATSHSGTAIVIGSGGAQSAATDALGVDAKISPTITVEQGTVIQVFVARDLHFGE